MINILLTYNIVNTDQRGTFEEDFKDVVIQFGLTKKSFDKNEYLGKYRDAPSFVKDVFNAVNRMPWSRADVVTVYYSKSEITVPKNQSDVQCHELKSFDVEPLNHIIWK